MAAASLRPAALPAGAPAMGLGAIAFFTALPLAALAGVVALLLRFELPLAGTLPWVPALGITLAWRIDGLAALMLLMITGVGTAVFVYAGGYLAGHPGQRRLYVLLTLFMLAMIGCVTADDLFTLFLFWEATSLLSFLLVGFEHERPAARKAAQQALLVTGTGGLALLAGLILVGQALGTSSISLVLPDPQAVLERGWIEVEGFEVLLSHFENDPGAMYMNFHFGIVTAGRTLQVFRLMLEANLTVYAQDQAQVGINPDTSGIVLIVRVPITDEVSGHWLAETLGHYAEHGRYWADNIASASEEMFEGICSGDYFRLRA